MALDFPTSPTNGQKYPASPIAGVPTYTWDGEKWTTTADAIGAVTYVAKAGDTMTGHLGLPTGPAAANAVRKDYVDAADSTLQTNINAKASASYVDSGDALKVAKAGDTMTGDLTISRSGSPTTGGITLGNGSANLNYNGTFIFNGGNMSVSGGALTVGQTVSTGIVYLGNSGTRYLQYDGGNYQLPGTNLYVGGGLNITSGTIGGNYAGLVFRPYALGDATNQVQLFLSGIMMLNGWNAYYGTPNGVNGGFQCKLGSNNTASDNYFNYWWEGTNGTIYACINQSQIGQLAMQSDYRMKKDVAPLGSMWDAVKALKPISYTIKPFTPPSEVERSKETQKPFITGDDKKRWGFIAHEVQETLIETTSSAVKDAPNAIQDLVLAPVVAALTKALQEAMARIEALEAAG